jgi:hypothetical protein
VTDDQQKERDWEREMREVDRLLSKLPTHETPASGPGPAGASGKSVTLGTSAAAGPSGGEWLGTWARVVLGLLVGIAMTQWPYAHGCGLRLIFYLVGVLVVLVAGFWSSLSSWRRRLGLAHILSQLLIIWGLVLAGREVLPRVGYAKVEAPWFCPDVTPNPR